MPPQSFTSIKLFISNGTPPAIHLPLVSLVNKHILQQLTKKNLPTSIRCWDSNSTPLKHESPRNPRAEPYPKKNIYGVKLCYAGFKLPEWKKKFQQPIRMHLNFSTEYWPRSKYVYRPHVFALSSYLGRKYRFCSR